MNKAIRETKRNVSKSLEYRKWIVITAIENFMAEKLFNSWSTEASSASAETSVSESLVGFGSAESNMLVTSFRYRFEFSIGFGIKLLTSVSEVSNNLLHQGYIFLVLISKFPCEVLYIQLIMLVFVMRFRRTGQIIRKQYVFHPDCTMHKNFM